MIEGVAQQLDKILHDYVEKVDETTDEIMEKNAKLTVDELKRTSPKSKGHRKYANSWAVTKQDHLFIVHNKKHYRLTHLLENGHVIRNQYGTYDRWNPKSKHIEPAEENAQARVIKDLESKL